MFNREVYEEICDKAKKYDDLMGVLDKIRDEIEEASNRCNNTIAKGCYLFCLGVLDKYKAESEVEKIK